MKTETMILGGFMGALAVRTYVFGCGCFWLLGFVDGTGGGGERRFRVRGMKDFVYQDFFETLGRGL